MAWHAGFPLVLLAVVVTSAQAPPRSVEDAEAEGSNFTKAVDAPDIPAFAEAFGPRERRCVDADTHAAARSGEFIAGPFHEYYSMAGAGRKVWWAPKHHSATMPPLRLRATKVGAPEVTVDWTLSSIARTENGYFFNTTIRFPQNGKWMVIASSGDNWGCFLLSEILAAK